VTDSEFDDVARRTADRLAGATPDERIAAACRGSGNPAALAWIAEECGVNPATRVVDLGTGLGGPAAWIAQRYGCRPVALEPARGAVAGIHRLFDLAVVRADAVATPLRTDGFDVALLLGVLSVVDAPTEVAAEAVRLAGRVAVIEYCSTRGGSVHAGGSTFPTRERLEALLVSVGCAPPTVVEMTMPSPPRWVQAQEEFDATDDDTAAAASEHAVQDAIAAGRLQPFVMVAPRAA
jgi:SAM-dependent methyltransferase